MASITVFVFVVSLLLHASNSFPTLLDVKTVNLSDIENPLVQKNPVQDVETILNHKEEIKLVHSLTTENVVNAFESVEENRGRRVRREALVSFALCPEETIRHGRLCLLKEKYPDDYFYVYDAHEVES